MMGGQWINTYTLIWWLHYPMDSTVWSTVDTVYSGSRDVWPRGLSLYIQWKWKIVHLGPISIHDRNKSQKWLKCPSVCYQNPSASQNHLISLRISAYLPLCHSVIMPFSHHHSSWLSKLNLTVWIRLVKRADMTVEVLTCTE